MNAIGFAVIDGDPIGIELGRGIGAARIERRAFSLCGVSCTLPIELRCRRLIETRLPSELEQPDRFQQAQRAERVGVGGVFRRLEADLDVALRGEIVDLVGLARWTIRIRLVASVMSP